MKAQLTKVIGALVVLTTLLALTVVPGQTLAQGTAPQGSASPDVIAPGALPIQGKLTNASGVPLTGTFNVTFRLYEVETGGTALCTDVHAVTTTNGLFSTYMDHCYGGDLTGQKVWLEDSFRCGILPPVNRPNRRSLSPLDLSACLTS